MSPLEVPQGRFTLSREPMRPKDPLRAWDAADELVLGHLADPDVATQLPDGPTLILNDAHGALTTALSERMPVAVSDSFVSWRAVQRNLAANGIDADRVRLLDPLSPLPEEPGLVVLRIPKSSAMLEDQLRRLARVVTPRTVVVGAAMAKHIHTSTLDAFAELLGPTTTSLATRKARLIFCTPEPTLDASADPWPSTYLVEPGPIRVTNRPSVFSPSRLDAGTSLLLERLPEVAPGDHVVDLGCGNGIVGTVVALDQPEAELTFVDESFMAVASARDTYDANARSGAEEAGGSARFVVGDGLAHLADGPPIQDGSVDLVLNNPPFHTDNAMGDATAWQMFSESHRALRSGGELWVVGNRHLAYHAKLKRLFGNCDVVASSPKFVLCRAVRH